MQPPREAHAARELHTASVKSKFVMNPRIHLVVDHPCGKAALYAMRVLVEPMGFEVVEGTGGDAEALRGDDAVVWSYGPKPPDLLAHAHLHMASCDDFWTSLGRASSLPPRPFHRIPATDLDLRDPGTEPFVLPYVTDARKGETLLARGQPGRLITRADLVASAFYFLTRYDETFISERDPWGRVPEDRPILVAEGLADRAPVDEYREILAGWVSLLLGRPVAPHPPGFEVLLTHDVDSGFRVTRGPFWSHVLRGMARDLVRHRSPRTALELGANATAVALRRPIPFGGVAEILHMAERYGRTSHFFFMANGTHPDDAAYDVREAGPVIRAIVNAGHRVGLHVGLDAVTDGTALRRERDLLADVMGRAPVGARAHFLSLDVVRTPRLLVESGLGFDSSAGFSSRCGFRTGTTRPHRLFDLETLTVLDLWEYPLAIMDKAVYDLPPATRSEVVRRIVATVRHHGGCLTLNWHYWYFTQRYRRLCEEILAASRDGRDAAISGPKAATGAACSRERSECRS